jgi:hypothetical protein
MCVLWVLTLCCWEPELIDENDISDIDKYEMAQWRGTKRKSQCDSRIDQEGCRQVVMVKVQSGEIV